MDAKPQSCLPTSRINMSPAITRLPSLLKRPAQQSIPQSTNITDAPNLPWHPIGPAADCLPPELEDLYWEGVKNELEVILFTLRKWQQPKYSSVALDDEADHFIHGFDTFIDQVSQESRAFAIRYSMFAPVSACSPVHWPSACLGCDGSQDTLPAHQLTLPSRAGKEELEEGGEEGIPSGFARPQVGHKCRAEQRQAPDRRAKYP